jgi:3-deoxy-D-manno-octulosonate 8-phosphate phosphatase (KDO 8-P phosphatase)
MDFAPINVLFLDVDGVLTDGRVTLTPEGETQKTFHVHDGSAIRVWQRASHRVAILSGRRSPAVDRRAGELGIDAVRQGVKDKASAYDEILRELRVADRNVCYVGDDWPDLGPMRRCGFPVAVADAIGPVKRAARYVTARPGGAGAAAEVIELVLRKQQLWNRALCEASAEGSG